MDPRLNPSLMAGRPQPNRAALRLVQDVVGTSAVRQPLMAPASSAPVPNTVSPATPHQSRQNQSPRSVQEQFSQPATVAVPQPLKPELVESIPLKTQELPHANPIASPLPTPSPTSVTPSHEAAEEDDLDRILQAVNSRVHSPAPPKAKLKAEVPRMLPETLSKAKRVVSLPRPLGAIAMTLIVAGVLTAVAIFAYRQGAGTSAVAKQPGKVGTSYTASSAIQAAGGTLVLPSDLDDFSQELQNKLNGLNDSQDFTDKPLSDQALGL